MVPITNLVSQLEVDTWRKRVGFSSELACVHEALFKADTSAAITILNEWLHRHQPCLFGRVAAKTDRIHYCILTHHDLRESDLYIREKIQAARTEWTKRAFAGQRSAFVIAVLSEDVAFAAPNESMRALACRLASLYLLKDIQPDRIYLDSIWLEKGGTPPVTWEWNVGANYFSSHGDGRWWSDHRFPGGIALSMNSVGHMMKSGALANAQAALDLAVGLSTRAGRENLDDLGDALSLAMRTIAGASASVSGPATFLLPESVDDPATRPACPIALPSPLKTFSHCQYGGWYHTDVTIPSEYFNAAVERPPSVPQHFLDFTYLFHRDIDNPEYDTMGTGRRIRSDGLNGDPHTVSSRATAIVRNVSDCPRLVAAIRGTTTT